MQQAFSREADRVIRSLTIENEVYTSWIADVADRSLSAEAAWWQSMLRGQLAVSARKRGSIKIVDAFCGSGGLALGIKSAAEAMGLTADFVAAMDADATALEIHKHNLKSKRRLAESVVSLVDFHVLGVGDEAKFGYDPEIVHKELSSIGQVDLFVAGPPCQGHSNLNNHTRRQDPRNDLYVTAVALGVAFNAEMIIVENVPTVLNSHSDVVSTAVGLLRSAGYGTSMAVLKADDLGGAQRRNRHFLLAVRGRSLTEDYLKIAAASLAAPAMPLSWAIGDLVDREPVAFVDTVPVPTSVNLARINYLFDHDIHDLPDAERPDCHKNGTTYTAVYGRMHWDRPAGTVTTGFGTPGQGRYIHPIRRRLITPHEAARVQGFPDWFDFSPPGVDVKRKHLTKWIGDAVHPMLGNAVGLAILAARVEAATVPKSAAA